MYDKGWLKSYSTEVPSICVGNVSVGGTGKTPVTELLIRTLRDDEIPAADAEYLGFDPGSLFFTEKPNIAVLSRGYKRKTKGFQQVVTTGSAEQYGDEPFQIKQKFPETVVAVDADRVEGCRLLAHPSKIKELPERTRRRIIAPKFAKSDIIILDDAYQYRRIKATSNIVLTTYSRPYFHDFLMPIGRLRDLRSRVHKADMVIVTKCPTYLEDSEKTAWAAKMKIKDYNPATCEGVTREGKRQKLLFATITYDGLEPVFPDGDRRYIHAKFAILLSGIANDTPLAQRLSETYKIVSHLKYPDHHYFTKNDVKDIAFTAARFPTSVVITTEKDAQRMRDSKLVAGQDLHNRMFYVPIRVQMLTGAEQNCLKEYLSEINHR